MKIEKIVRIEVDRIPEALFEMRKVLAQMLRGQAEDESPVVAARLRAIASRFEAGQP